MSKNRSEVVGVITLLLYCPEGRNPIAVASLTARKSSFADSEWLNDSIQLEHGYYLQSARIPQRQSSPFACSFHRAFAVAAPAA